MPTLTEVLDEYGVPWQYGGEHGSVSAGWVGLNCPFCLEADEDYHLGWSPDGVFTCWKCGAHPTGSTLSALLGIPVGASIEISKELTPEDGSEIKLWEQRTRVKYPEGVGPLLKMHADYLRSRRLDVALMKHLWGLQGIGNIQGFYRRRILIPVEFRGRVISWITRAIDADVERRYSAAPRRDEVTPHKSILFGEDLAGTGIIIHEGPFDVFATGPGAVAVCGTGVSPAQIRKISNHPLRVICFDSSPTAQNRAEELADLLRIYSGKTLVVRLDAKDAGEASPRELAKLRKIIGK